METIVRRIGAYALIQEEEGFVWVLTCKTGDRWYWHPQERVWTGCPQPCPTVAEALAGFDPEAPLKEGHFHHHDALPLPHGFPPRT